MYPIYFNDNSLTESLALLLTPLIDTEDPHRKTGLLYTATMAPLELPPGLLFVLLGGEVWSRSLNGWSRSRSSSGRDLHQSVLNVEVQFISVK